MATITFPAEVSTRAASCGRTLTSATSSLFSDAHLGCIQEQSANRMNAADDAGIMWCLRWQSLLKEA